MKDLQERYFMQLFQLKGYVPFLISSVWSEVYLPLRALAIYTDNIWRSYMPKEEYRKTGEEGVRLYGNRERYLQFQSDIKASFQSASVTFDTKLSLARLAREDVEACLHCLIGHLRLYQKTEFFYTDLPFEQKGTSRELKENLASYGDFKLQARKHLNKVFFGSTSCSSRFFRKISKNLNIPFEDVQVYGTEEILDAYSKNFRLTRSELDERKQAFFSYPEKGATAHLFGEAAYQKANFFYGTKSKSLELHGQVANKGHATGRARVFNFNLEEFDEVHKLVKAMQEGEILIAETTAPEIILACKKAAAIVTNQGGMMSHAAIVSRELNIPCVVATHRATLEINTGDLVEVDTNKGVVRVLQRR